MSSSAPSPTTDADALSPGAVLAGKYRVVRPLGDGGMAIVVLAEHVKLGQQVAIKVLRQELTGDAALVERFEREGRAISRLKSRNVVRVFDVDVTPAGAPFLVMELLDGGDLEQELRARGPLPIGEAVSYVLQACAAMQEAHEQGIVHRDLKPTNLFLANEGVARVVKVLDFGIAMDTPGAADVRLTKTESVMGTPLYMAPEQFRSAKGIDARADVWALGATLYELLTGHPPFTGTATTIGVSIVTEAERPIDELRADVPAGLRAVVRRALEKDREKRFPTMQAMADALRPFDDGVVVAPRSTSQSMPDAIEMQTAKTLHAVESATLTTPPPILAKTQTEPPPRSGGLRWWPVGVLVALVGIVALVVSYATKSAPTAPAAATTSASSPPSALVAPTLPPSAAPTASPAAQASASPPAVADAGASQLKPGAARIAPSQAAPSQATPHARPPTDQTSHPLFFPQ